MKLKGKFLFAALFVTALGVSCAPSGAAVKVEPSLSTIQKNELVNVPIKIENVINLSAIEVHISFNANVLEVTDLIESKFISADFKVQNAFDNTAGTVDYAVAQIDRAPVSGNGILFEIVFRAKASGESMIKFRETQAAPTGLLLSDSKGTAIPFIAAEGSVTVK